MENPYHPIDPMWHIVQNHIEKEKHRKMMKEIEQLFIRQRKNAMSIILTAPKMSIDIDKSKGMVCGSFLKNHGHCIICFIKGCECYPLDLWACVVESIGKIKGIEK